MFVNSRHTNDVISQWQQVSVEEAQAVKKSKQAEEQQPSPRRHSLYPLPQHSGGGQDENRPGVASSCAGQTTAVGILLPLLLAALTTAAPGPHAPAGGGRSALSCHCHSRTARIRHCLNVFTGRVGARSAVITSSLWKQNNNAGVGAEHGCEFMYRVQ